MAGFRSNTTNSQALHKLSIERRFLNSRVCFLVSFNNMNKSVTVGDFVFAKLACYSRVVAFSSCFTFQQTVARAARAITQRR